MMIDDNSNLGIPEVEWCWHMEATGAAATGEKSTKPLLAAITVPITKSIKIEID